MSSFHWLLWTGGAFSSLCLINSLHYRILPLENTKFPVFFDCYLIDHCEANWASDTINVGLINWCLPTESFWDYSPPLINLEQMQHPHLISVSMIVLAVLTQMIKQKVYAYTQEVRFNQWIDFWLIFLSVYFPKTQTFTTNIIIFSPIDQRYSPVSPVTKSVWQQGNKHTIWDVHQWFTVSSNTHALKFISELYRMCCILHAVIYRGEIDGGIDD